MRTALTKILALSLALGSLNWPMAKAETVLENSTTIVAPTAPFATLSPHQDLILVPTPELDASPEPTPKPFPLNYLGNLQSSTLRLDFLFRAATLLNQKNPTKYPAPNLDDFVQELPARLLNLTRHDLGALSLLAQGHSNFATSPTARIANVHKAADEKFKAIFIPTGSTFSFVDLVGPIDGENGWKKALNIFRGTDLEYAPGGGVCQMSTTIYRAALKAGLPVTEHRNHSLYVHYYEADGSGLDATVFPGVQDLKFVNNTGAPIVLISQIHGEDLYVNLYGTPDGRNTNLVGPFTASNESDAVLKEFGDLGIGQIVWKYTVQDSPSSEPKVTWLLSDYMSKVKQHRELIEEDFEHDSAGAPNSSS